VEAGVGVGADPDVEGGGVEDPILFGGAPVSELVFPEREMESFLFMGRKDDTLEAFQFANRARGAAVLLVNVELRDFISRDVAGV